MDDARKSARDEEMGEGNRKADRRYRKAATRFARSGSVPEAAREAAEDLEEGREPAPGRESGREDRDDRL